MTDINHSERAHHPDFPPSSLPAFAKCPCYKSSDTVGQAAIRGTQLHEKLEEILCSTELVKEIKKANTRRKETSGRKHIQH
jgi:hypothetical protein|tara:strand:- start:414 stop:656 length:243 start_codon:yes stop_codon:yes gene_type:complete